MWKMLALVAMSLLVIIGCGGDEEEPEEPSKEDLVGSWEVVSIGGETPDKLAASILGGDGVETKATKKDYVFVADNSWYANLGFQGEADLGSGLSITGGMTFSLKGKYTVSGSKLSSVLEEVNVTLTPKDLWESGGITEEAVEQELRGEIFSTESYTWSLSGNTLNLIDDEGSKTVLRK